MKIIQFICGLLQRQYRKYLAKKQGVPFEILKHWQIRWVTLEFKGLPKTINGFKVKKFDDHARVGQEVSVLYNDHVIHVYKILDKHICSYVDALNNVSPREFDLEYLYSFPYTYMEPSSWQTN